MLRQDGLGRLGALHALRAALTKCGTRPKRQEDEENDRGYTRKCHTHWRIRLRQRRVARARVNAARRRVMAQILRHLMHYRRKVRRVRGALERDVRRSLGILHCRKEGATDA